MTEIRPYRLAYAGIAVAMIAATITSDAGPSTGYYPKTASFPPATCGIGEFVRWGGVTWACAPAGASTAPVQSVRGTSPIVVTPNDAGVYTVSEQVDTSNLQVTDGGIGVKPNVDLHSMKFDGVLVIGPSASSPALYATDASSVLSVSEVLGANTVNLSTVGGGSTDWLVPWSSNYTESCNGSTAKKISGNNSLACRGGVYSVNTAGTLGTIFGNTSSCTIGITWSAADANWQNAPIASNSCNYNGLNYSPSPAGDFGFSFVIPAATYQQVARIYTSYANGIGTKCDGSLTDGSGAVASTAPTTTGGSQYKSDTWTFRARYSGSFLVVYCHLGTPTGAASTIAWLGVEVGLL